MAKVTTTLTIFLSSPGDLAGEKKAVMRAVDSVNIQLKTMMSVRFEVWDWQNDVIPGVSDSAQGVIDQQIPDHDIYLGLMWTKFGTPTSGAGSGTEHEFINSLSTHKEKGKPKHILFFFKTHIDSLDGLDHEQYGKVDAFKKRLSSMGVLYGSFLQFEDLERLLMINLSKIAGDWKNSEVQDFEEDASSEETDSEIIELGYLDYLEKMEDSFHLVGEAGVKLGGLLANLSRYMTQRTLEMQNSKDIKGRLNHRVARSITNEFSNDLENFVAQANPVLDEMLRNFECGIESISSALSLESMMEKDKDHDLEDIAVMAESIRGLWVILDDMDQSFSSFRHSMVNTPNLSVRYNRAKNRLIGFIDQFRVVNSRLRSLTSNVLGIAESYYVENDGNNF